MSNNSKIQTKSIKDASLEQTVRKAVNAASIGALRIALYHQTGDSFLADMPVTALPVRGGALTNYVVPKEHHQYIRDKAYDFLIGTIAGNISIKKPPTLDEAEALMTMYSGKKPSSAERDYGFDELAFSDFSRRASWTNKPEQAKLEQFKVTIIGSGFSGIAAAIQLQQLNIPFRIIERHPKVGGTWHVNDYPEARVDVPTFLYQYKFEKNYAWKSFFATVDELRDYANYIVDEYGLREHISFNTQLKSSVWDEQQKRWVLEVESTDTKNAVNTIKETIISNAVISATGVFGIAQLPDIAGIESYKGKMFHTTQWDHNFDLKGKKVALIGTGSTGTQLARAVAKDASQFTIFQRSANWVTPITGYHAKISSEVQWMFDNMPGYLNWFIYTNYYAELNMQDLQELDPEWIAKGGKVNAKNQALREVLTEFIKTKTASKPELFEQLIPTHSPLSRRLVIDNEWYDTLVRDNVQLITGGIEEITENGIRDKAGVEHEFDLIILGAGFKVSKYLWPVEYKGRDGVTIEDMWKKDGARAFKGMTIPNFPNFFMLYGPNAQGRAGAFHSVIEGLTRYVAGLLTYMIEQDAETIEVKQEVYQNYNDKMDAALTKLLWEDEQGGGSYYVNEHGRAGLNMPWRLPEFNDMIKKVDTNNYLISK